MSLPWRDELRMAVCPRRLVLARYRRMRLVESSVVALTGEPGVEAARLAAKERVAIVLSSHLVRYALLPWTPTLRSAREWSEYAQHIFSSTYGEAAAAWEVNVCSTGFRRPRLAITVDAALLASLRAIPGVVSIRPHLMSAFNARRQALRRRDAWFVLQEEGRITFALLSGGEWRALRSRRIHGEWQVEVPDLLDREAAGGFECDDIFLCAEAMAPGRLGRYRVTDVSLPRGALA